MDPGRALSLSMCALALAACAAWSPSQSNSGVPDIAAALPNLAYRVDYGSAQTVTLTDGQFNGGPADLTARLGPARGYGDADGDGRTDAATTLFVAGGGSGTFVFLALVLDRPEGPRALPTVLLGDRVRVTKLTVRPGIVEAVVCERAPGAPMSEQACTDKTRRYEVRGERLDGSGMN